MQAGDHLQLDMKARSRELRSSESLVANETPFAARQLIFRLVSNAFQAKLQQLSRYLSS
jgi:hypothetical protein